MSARIIVLGADGFIGRRVVAALAASDWATPIAAGRRVASAAGPVERIRVDATDAASLQAAFTGAAGVVNCVAGDASTIVATARALFDAAAKTSPVVVDFSSMAVYGSATGTVDEDAPLSGDTGPYAAAKIEAERIARRYPRAVSLRPGIVYGPGSAQWSERIARWLLARRVGDMGAAGDGYCNLVHVDDVAKAAVRALRLLDAQGRPYNLGMLNPPTWNEYFLRYAKALGAVPVRRITGRHMKLEKLAAIPLKIAEIAAGKAKLKLALPPPIPPSLTGVWRQEIKLDVRRAERELGMVWTSLDAGLRDAAAPYKRN
jgi:nucleoside-diphosphate-sugar epimerase